VYERFFHHLAETIHGVVFTRESLDGNANGLFLNVMTSSDQFLNIRGGIVSTVFWIGETGSGPANRRSAWDNHWIGSDGGVDDPLGKVTRDRSIVVLLHSDNLVRPTVDLSPSRTLLLSSHTGIRFLSQDAHSFF
jgi:hypothetical protein